MRLFNLIGKALNTRRAKTGEETLSAGVPMGHFTFPYGVPPTYDKDAVSKYSRSWAWTCARKNAVEQAGAVLRLYVRRGTGETLPKNFPFRTIRKAVGEVTEDAVELTEHPFLDLMQTVNGFRNGFDFREETSLWMDCTGDAYWYVERGPLGTPSELWLLNSNLIRIVPSETDFIRGYLYGTPGKQVALPVEDVVHFRLPGIQSLYYGTGRIESAFLAIATSQERQEFERQLIVNRGTSDVVVKYAKGEPTQEQRRELTRVWTQRLRKQGVKVMGQDWSFEKPGFSPREFIAMNARQWDAEEIIAAFGQTRAIYSESASRANVEAAIYLWGRSEIDPSLKRLSQKINERLLPEWDARLYCEFDAVAMRDKEFDLQQQTADVANHVRTVNEIRESRNLEPFDDERANDPFYAAPVAASPLFGQPLFQRGETEADETRRAAWIPDAAWIPGKRKFFEDYP